MVVWRLCARSSCNENLVAGLRCEKMKPNPACNGTIELNPTMSARPHVLPCCFLSQASTLVATFGKGNGPNPQPMIHLFLILPFRNCLRTDLQCPKSQMHLQASKQSAISWSGVSLSVLCVCVCFLFCPGFRVRVWFCIPIFARKFSCSHSKWISFVSLLGGFGIFLQKQIWVVIVAFAKVAEFLVFLWGSGDAPPLGDRGAWKEG